MEGLTCLVFMITLLIIIYNKPPIYYMNHCLNPGSNVSHPECASPIIARRFRGHF